MTTGGRTVDDAAATEVARARVAAILEQAAHVQLDVVVIAPPNAIRIAARDRAIQAALAAGRGALLDQAVDAARDRAARGFAAGGYSGNWAATDMSISVARAPDRVAAAAALEEAVTAAVVEDLVDPETAETLEASWRSLADFRAIPVPGSLSNIGSAVMQQRGMRGLLAFGIVALAIFVSLASGSWAIGIGLLVIAAVIGWRVLSGPGEPRPGR
jgi:hypothetical protein